MANPELAIEDLAGFLCRHHGTEVDELELLRGGFWSAAYGYRVGDERLVARFGRMRDGFEMDRAAMRFARPGLPVPEVLDVGDAFDRSFAISRRADGTFLEDVTVDEAETVAPLVARLLGSLRSAEQPADTASAWYPASVDPSTSTWRGWLLDGLVDDPSRPVSGWRARLAADERLDALFERCRSRVVELLDACPERRDLVHGDLLHQNVLVAHDRSEITAVFSWKCSVLGDFVFDTAWCTFWSPWHPGIAAIDPWSLLLGADDLTPADRVDLALRHHCYEIHIGATHLGWCAWTDDVESLEAVAARVAEILDRGPLTEP
jgi:aminoglycoside phosphotransferase (APT) family kinase protein